VQCEYHYRMPFATTVSTSSLRQAVDDAIELKTLLEQSQHKLAAITAVEAATLIVFTLYLLRRFASPAVPWWVLVFVFFGWLLGLSGVLLLPLDLAFTKSNDLFSSESLIRFWEGMFWTTAVMAYAILPLLKGVVSSGAFSCAGKVRASLKANFTFYAVAVGIGIAALVWVWLSGQTMSAFLGFIMALSNIYGLLLLIVLMSYGFVDVPRYLWRMGDYSSRLRALQLQVSIQIVCSPDATCRSHGLRLPICRLLEWKAPRMRQMLLSKTSATTSMKSRTKCGELLLLILKIGKNFSHWCPN